MLRSSRLAATILLATLFVLGCTPLYAVNWLPFGPDGGDARRIVVDPRDHNHLYLGTANGWLYQSRNGGANWARVARPGKRDDLALDSIVVDPTDPKHLIVGAKVIGSRDGGLYISHDAGATWVNQAEMRGQAVLSLGEAASDPKVLIAGTLQGVFRSIDNGQRWKLISPVDSVEIHNVESIAIDPKDPNIIYAGTWHLPWKTTDGGDHWDNIKEGIIDDSDVFSIIVDPRDPQTVFASACSGIYKSLNGGERFSKVQGIPSAARRTRVLLQDPNHLATVFAGTTEGLWRSDDTGKTWTRTTGPEVIVNDVHIDPADSRRVMIATDRGGILSSDDGGDTFKSSNGGFSARQITTLKKDFQHPARLYVGIVNDKEWGGVFQSDNGALSWQQRSDGLQGRDVFSLGQAPDGTMIAGTNHGLYRLATEETTWKRVEDAPGTGAAMPVTPAVRAAVLDTRPPVPIGRNQYVNRNVKKPLTAAQRKAAVVKGKHTPPAKSKAKPTTAAGRRAQALAAKKKITTMKRGAVPAPKRVVRPATVAAIPKTEVIATPVVAPTQPGFDGSVLGIVTVGKKLLAATSQGLLTSADNGQSWLSANVDHSEDWRFLASAKSNVISASLHDLWFSADAGLTWTPIRAPEQILQLAAVAVDPSGQIWVGGREGLYVSSDGGSHWATPKNLYVNSVSNIFYDEPTDRVLVTTAGDSSIVFTVQLPSKQVTYAYSGWNLRFARPVGDHVVAATLFDGMVVQPKMVDSPMAAPAAAAK